MTIPSDFTFGPEFQFTSLTSENRLEIVDLAGNFRIGGAAYIDVNHLALSALGADADLDGKWDVQGFTLAEWRHIGTGGRDQYVRVVYRGYLFPIGHRAVMIDVFERVLVADPVYPNRWSDAVVLKKTFIKVIQPVKPYPAPGQPYSASWPFTSVEIKTIISPPIDSTPPGLVPPPTPTPTNTTPLPQGFRITTGNPPVDVSWTIVATDHAGRDTHMQTPLCFVFAEDSHGAGGADLYPDEHNATYTEPLAAAYNGLDPTFRQADAAGKLIQFAPEAGGPAGGTSHPTLDLTLVAAVPGLDPTAATQRPAASPGFLAANDQPAFYPALGAARIRLPAADALTKSAFGDSGGPGVSIDYYPAYVVNGFSGVAPNPGTVYARTSDSLGASPEPPLLKFPGDTVGGIGTPNTGISGLSAVVGPVGGDLHTFATQGSQLAHDYFAPSPGQAATDLPQLLGGLQLADVVYGFSDPSGQPTIPLITTEVDPATGRRRITYSVRASLTLFPGGGDPSTIDPWPVPDTGGYIFIPRDANGALTLTSVTDITPGLPPKHSVSGTVTPFVIQIAGSAGSALYFVLIPVEKLRFTSASGGKPDIKVKLGTIQFRGALEYLNDLEQFLNGLGGSDFAVSVLGGQITAGFSLGLPSISLGIVNLHNLRLSAGVVVPFDGKPAVASFGFASKEHPFLVTVAMFGGGGYVALDVGLTAVRRVEVSIDFAGSFCLDVGVASGGVTVAAGATFVYDSTTGISLTAFIKLSGEISVLGLISISAEFDLQLQYAEDGSQSSLSGDAELDASVHIIFFSITVPIHVHKQFSGSPIHSGPSSPAMALHGSSAGTSSPKMSDLVSAEVWSKYCSSFSA